MHTVPQGLPAANRTNLQGMFARFVRRSAKAGNSSGHYAALRMINS